MDGVSKRKHVAQATGPRGVLGHLVRRVGRLAFLSASPQPGSALLAVDSFATVAISVGMYARLAGALKTRRRLVHDRGGTDLTRCAQCEQESKVEKRGTFVFCNPLRNRAARLWVVCTHTTGVVRSGDVKRPIVHPAKKSFP